MIVPSSFFPRVATLWKGRGPVLGTIMAEWDSTEWIGQCQMSAGCKTYASASVKGAETISLLIGFSSTTVS